MRLTSRYTERQTVEMCLAGVMLSEIVKPRLGPQVVNGMLALPTEREVG